MNQKYSKPDNFELFPMTSILALNGLKSENAQGYQLGTRWNLDKHPLDDKNPLKFRSFPTKQGSTSYSQDYHL